MIRRVVTLLAFATLLAATAAGAQEPSEPQRVAADAPTWAVEVIELHYADAEELAFVLSQVVPPAVTVVPYRPTNSLIIAGDPAIVAELAKARAK